MERQDSLTKVLMDLPTTEEQDVLPSSENMPPPMQPFASASRQPTWGPIELQDNMPTFGSSSLLRLNSSVIAGSTRTASESDITESLEDIPSIPPSFGEQQSVYSLMMMVPGSDAETTTKSAEKKALPVAPKATPAPASAELLYPSTIQPMSMEQKKVLVEKITLLPSHCLHRLLNVISLYQPDMVRRMGADYDFDLGDMNENTVYAIKDFIDASPQKPNANTKANSNGSNANVAVDANTTLTALQKDSSQVKFLEQVNMYTKKKRTKSKAKPSKDHQCNICQKQFRGRSELLNHIRTHTGEKPLVCSFKGCGKRYAHSSNLRAHERSHKGIKPYVCHYDGCGKRFAHSVSLKEHIWMHAGVQPYECPYPSCRRRFTQVSNFSRHKKVHERNAAKEATAAKNSVPQKA